MGICREHGLEVETEAIYGGKMNRQKSDYIIAAQQEKIAALEKLHEALTADNAAKTGQIAAKSAELEAKLENSPMLTRCWKLFLTLLTVKLLTL